MTTSKQIRVLVYKENTTLWMPSGLTRSISCNHQYLAVEGINMAGEIVPIPTSTVPPSQSSDNTDYQTATALVQIGQVWVDTKYFGDANFKVVVKVKDMDTNIVSWVDATSYSDNIALCNFVPEPAFCPAVTGLDEGTPTDTTATISWAGTPGAAGVEYINNTSGTAPVIDGTYLDGGATSVSLTGLTPSTEYHFWVRTVCGLGSRSAWTSLTYSTTS